jgi:hypothetical protein
VMRLVSRDGQWILALLVEWLIKDTFTALAPWTVHSKQDLDFPDGEFVRSCERAFSARSFALEVQVPTNSDNISIYFVEVTKLVNIFNIPGHPQSVSFRYFRSKWTRNMAQAMKGQSVRDDTKEECSKIT